MKWPFVLMVLMVSFGGVFAINEKFSRYYDLNEVSGNALNDINFQNNFSQIGTVPNQTGKVAGSRGSYSTSNFFNANVPSQVVGVGFWVYFPNPTQNFGTVLSFNRETSGTTCFLRFPMINRTHFKVYGASNAACATQTDFFALSNLSIPQANWSFIYLQYNGNLVDLYINSQKFATSSVVPVSPNNISGIASMSLGVHNRAPTERYDPLSNAYVDELFITNTTLTQTDINIIWNNGLGNTYPIASSGIPAQITATNQLNGTSLLNLFATVNGTTYSTTNGTIILPINATNTNAWTIVVNATDNEGFLDRTYSNYNFSLSGNLAAQLVQARVQFKATELFTGNAISTFNVTLNGTAGTDTTIFNATAGTYQVAWNKLGYINSTQSFVIPAVSVANYTFVNMSNSLLNLTIANGFTGSLVNANVSILPNSYAASLIEYFGINQTFVNLLNGSYTITVSTDGFIGNTTTYNISAGFQNITVQLFPSNSFSFRFFDESTFSNLSNVQWTLFGATQGLAGHNGTATTGNFTLSNLPNGQFELRYQPLGYQPRSYYVSVPAISPTDVNLSLYSVTNASSLPFIVTVTDRYNQFVDGLTLSLLRRYVVNQQTTFYVVEQSKPVRSANGQAIVYAVPNVVPYLFRVTDASGTVLYQGSATTSSNFETIYLIDQNLFIKINEADSVFQKITGVTNASVQLYNVTSPTSNTFWLSYDSRPASFDETCLVVVKNAQTLIHNQCYPQTSGIVSYTDPAPEDGATYTAHAIFKDRDNQAYVIDTEAVSYEENPVGIWGILGVGVLLITIIVFVFVFADNPQMIVISSVLAVMAWGTSFIPIAAISTITQGTLLVAAFILMLLMREK